MRRGYVSVGLAVGTVAATVLSAGGFHRNTAPVAVSTYNMTPTPMAPEGSLASSERVTLVLTAKDGSGNPIAGASTYLSFGGIGGGSATAWGKTLSSTPLLFHANTSGQITMTYTAASVPPSRGVDTITAANAASSPSVSSSDSYDYTTAAADPQDWPMFHHDPTHTGGSPDTTIGASNSSSLAPSWQVSTGQSSESSPVVVFNQTLGRDLVYLGGTGGYMKAIDATTGALVWQYKAGGQISSTPAVVGNAVYFGSYSHYITALNAATGRLICRYLTSGRTVSSPVVADPDGKGNVVYIGDSGLNGQADGGNFWAIDATTCALRWVFNGFGKPPGSQPNAGVYSEPGYALDATGRPLVIFGSTDPDDAVYALDARTGTLVWRFQTLVVNDGDIGAGPTISLPGTNGISGGAVYITGKDDITYGLDLTTGAELWSHVDGASTLEAQSVAALVGRTLYLGYHNGLWAIDAVTGQSVWKVSNLPAVISSPAVVGPSGDQVLLFGDAGGDLRAYDLSGHPLWAYALGGAIYTSPAVSHGTVFINNAANDLVTAFRP